MEAVLSAAERIRNVFDSCGNATIFFTFFVIAVVVYYFGISLTKRRLNLPPGPYGLPIVGYMPFMGESEHETFHELRKKYGPVFRLRIGQMPVVVLNDHASIKESGSKDEMQYRPPTWTDLTYKLPNFIFMSGAPWKNQRKFFMTTMRQLGTGKLQIEEKLQEQIQLVIRQFGDLSGKPETNIRDILSPALNNTMFSFVSGRTVEPDDPATILLSEFQFQLFNYLKHDMTSFFFPYLKTFVRKFNSAIKEARPVLERFQNLMREDIKEHEVAHDPNYQKDYIDMFLAEMKTNDDSFTKDILIGNASLLMLGGSETMRSTIEWTLLCLAEHPKVQEKVYQEIENTIGPEKLPSWNDHDQLIYTRAVIHEVMRYKTLGAFADPHWTNCDTTVKGYDIPKDTLILINIWSVHHDEEVWGDPEVFRPERFLSDDGKKIENTTCLIPFNIGKRNCPGEKLADIGIFLYVVSLVQKYSFHAPPGGVCLDEMSVMTQMVVKPVVRIEAR